MATARHSLRNSTEILRLLTNTVNKLENGTIDEGRARCITYICSTAGQIVKNLELEKRIEELERIAEEREV